MNASLKTASLIVAVLLLGSCASMPEGPSQMALPGTGKSFEQFQMDDAACRQYANVQIGGTPNQAGNDSFARSAAVGTAVGAAVGVAAGGGRGAGIGAATGMAAGSVIGSGESHMSAYEAQHRYDNAYIQCMYARGHRVPVSARFTTEQRSQSPAYYPPPPPPPNSKPPQPAPYSSPQ